MPHYHAPYRGATPPTNSSSHYYPGINQPDVEAELKAQASSITPYSPYTGGSNFTPPGTSAPNVGKSTGGGFSIPNIGDIKGFIERMGGIEGILATVGKVQKVMQTVQQFAPMAKLITGLLPGANKGTAALQSDDTDYSEYKPRRKRKKTKKGPKSKSSGRSRKRRSTPTKRKR